MLARRDRLIAEHLLGIELQLRQLGFWQEIRPPADRLASTSPFCCDTLEFPQWLQFVFLKKMRVLLETSASLPATSAIAPYAEEYFKGSEQQTRTLLAHLVEIDKLLSEN